MILGLDEQEQNIKNRIEYLTDYRKHLSAENKCVKAELDCLHDQLEELRVRQIDLFWNDSYE